jgi:uncharacterized membrane protein
MKVHLCLQFSQSAIVWVLHQKLLELALGKWFVFHRGFLVTRSRKKSVAEMTEDRLHGILI